jgi:Skp family chaperone for outer membrane proteins
MTKKTMIIVAAVSVLSGGLVVATNAFAQTPAGQSSMPSLVQEIADKFHLNTGDVQSVFNQHRQEMTTKREANYESYLQNLVNTGKITDAQKQLILNKHKELMSQMQSNLKNFKTMTPAQRKAQMQASMQDLQSWAKQNNIPLQYLGMGRFGKFGWHKPISPTP